MHRLFFPATNRPGRGLIAVPLRSCAQVTIDWSYSVLLFPVWASTTFIGWSCLPHFFVRLVMIKNKYFPHIFSIDINPMIVSIWTYLLKRRHQNSLSKRSWLFNSNGEIVALSDQQFLRLSVNLLLRVAIVFSLIRKQIEFFILLPQQPPVGQGLLILEVSIFTLNDAPQSVDSSGRVISPSQRPLPHNTQHSQETDIHVPVGFEPTIPANERPQT